MASTNVSRPFGFRPTRYLSGAPYNGQTQPYAFSASQANDAYVGDVVKFDSTNEITSLTDRYMPGLPQLIPLVAGTTTTAIRGVIAGFVPDPEFNMTVTKSLGTMYRLASTLRYAWVVDDYNVIFEAEEDGQTYVSVTDTAVGETIDLAYTAGSTTTGVSAATLDSSDHQASSARPFRILRYTQRPDNFGFVAADTLSYAHFDVLIANSDLAQGNVGIA